jgi:hypothetical protein
VIVNPPDAANPPLGDATLLDLYTAAALVGLSQTLYDPDAIGRDARAIGLSALHARAADTTP